MLLWAVKSPQNDDPIIYSSARGMLQRLNHTYDEDLRVRFLNWIQ